MEAIIRHVAFAAALVAGTAAAQAAVPPLKLCADPANLPFSSNAPEDVSRGRPGLYVEIGKAVADALGRPMETVWSQSIFGKRNLRTTLLAGQCDLAVGLPATADFMGPKLLYTRPILSVGYALVVPKGSAVRTLADLKGQRVAVQFGSPPQGLVAERADLTAVTGLSPEEAMRKLSAGAADAAFVWGPSASWINRTELRDAYDVIAVESTQLQWPAAIGVSGKAPALRDELDAALVKIGPQLRELGAKYAVAMASSVRVADAGNVVVAAADTGVASAAQAPASAGDASAGVAADGKAVFDGTCAHCHGPNAVVADRKINLRLLKKKYGDQMEEVFFTTVTNGRPAKGMPTWKDVFKQQDFANILAFLKTVQEP